MNIKNLDHLVITTRNLDSCLHFYVKILGMACDRSNGRYAVRFGNQKFNIHTKKAEFLPAAAHPTCGSLDLCLVVDGDLDSVKREIERKGYSIEEVPVARHGRWVTWRVCICAIRMAIWSSCAAIGTACDIGRVASERALTTVRRISGGICVLREINENDKLRPSVAG